MNSYSEEIGSVVEALGYRVVEERMAHVKGGLKFTIFIYKDSGVGSDDCDEVSRALLGRLEVLSGGLDVLMEVSSPGIDRVFKSNIEYKIFSGKMVQANFPDGRTVKDILISCDEQGVTIGAYYYRYDEIAKCRLI